MKQQTTKKLMLSLPILILTSVIGLSLGMSNAQARGKGSINFDGEFYKNPYLLEYDYVCKPQYIKRWVWSKKHGRKVLHYIRIKDRCNVHYR